MPPDVRKALGLPAS